MLAACAPGAGLAAADLLLALAYLTRGFQDAGAAAGHELLAAVCADLPAYGHPALTPLVLATAALEATGGPAAGAEHVERAVLAAPARHYETARRKARESA